MHRRDAAVAQVCMEFVGVPAPTGNYQQVEIPADRQLDWVHRKPGILLPPPLPKPAHGLDTLR